MMRARILCAFAALVLISSGCSRSGLEREDAGDASVDVFDATDDVRRDADTTFPPDATDSGDVDADVGPDLPPGVCGDGVVNQGEQCDDGEGNSNALPDACRMNCQLPSCGDFVLDSGEECDDGNDIDNDACDSACLRIAVPCVECRNDGDCGRTIDRCVRLIDGPFCTVACSDEGTCPAGLTCRNITTTSGPLARQCVPELEVCAGCFDLDGDGYGIGLECQGFDCDDTNPNVNPAAIEICNDIDDDCDGENDEGCPPDLIVDAETIRLSGDHLYDRVEVRNGGQIRVAPSPAELTNECTPDGPGCLSIEARIIVIRAESGIDASGAGQCARGVGDPAGFGPGLRNVGPGGGAYGGAGGSGPGLSGGEPYGTADRDDIQMGSPGRGFSILQPGFDGQACDDLVGLESAGGSGGGCVRLEAPDIEVLGYVRSNGVGGESARDGSVPGIVDGGAGGAGGGIALFGTRVRLQAGAQLSARGGAGGRGATYQRGVPDGDQCIGNGGGGGGGGRIKIFGGSTANEGATLDVSGGSGAEGPQNNATGGQRGSVFVR